MIIKIELHIPIFCRYYIYDIYFVINLEFFIVQNKNFNYLLLIQLQRMYVWLTKIIVVLTMISNVFYYLYAQSKFAECAKSMPNSQP